MRRGDRIVGDERLADVVARAAVDEAEVERLATGGKVGERVRHDPREKRHQKDHRDRLDREGSVARIVDELTRSEALALRVRDRGH